MSTPEVRWERMFPDQLEAAFAACPAAWFSYGLCEPHGPQNAVGLDTLKAHGIACRAAQTHGGIVAPPDQWHIHEIGGYAHWAHTAVGRPARTWLTAMPPWQHFKNICYHLRVADVTGFHAAIFLTGHYGPNWEDLKTLIEIAQPHVGTRLYALPDFECNDPGFDGDGKVRGDHAGKVETSLLWALEPGCVDVSRLPDRENIDGEGAPHFAMGRNAHEADRRVGERMVNDEVRWLGGKMHELLEEYKKVQPKHTLRTFADVERLWAEHVQPRLKDFKTMQQAWTWHKDPLPTDSMWYENHIVPDLS